MRTAPGCLGRRRRALLALLAWYLAELIARGAMTGLAERAMCVALVGWPLMVVLSCRRPPAQPDLEYP
jgi:hypothetical protein